MGLEDVLRQKRERQALAAEEAAKAPVIAQARRFAFRDRVRDVLIDALKRTGDPAFSNPTEIKLSDMGTSPIQIECASSSGKSTFKCRVECKPGAAEATCTKIDIILPDGSKGQYHPTASALGFDPIPESQFIIDPRKLLAEVERAAG